ncbi:type II restriction enzyme [Anabaena sp. FACHB-1237]|uniref:type II restriction enzyme n=1 Tax=Anabaena sp. FACHB-1237 TaxID=2692769 RepID=UPI0037BFF6B1
MNKQETTSQSKDWKAIFEKYKIYNHDFTQPYFINAKDIKEVRIICKQDTRESRPDIFQKLRLFLLPVKNGEYAILKGEGYIDKTFLLLNNNLRFINLI